MEMITVAIAGILVLLSLPILLLIRTFAGKSIGNPEYPPLYGTVYGQFFYMNKLHDRLTEIAKKQKTFRMVAAGYSEIYTTDPRNVEHILKTKFEQYSIGSHVQEIAEDVLGEGIFTVNGHSWRQQRKLASHEFSTRVLRDFSCSVFRNNAINLVRTISQFSPRDFDLQDLFMRCALDTIFKIGFGVELNCLEDSKGGGLMIAFDDINASHFWRFVNPFWKLNKFLNIGSEASAKKNLEVINNLVYGVIRNKRNLLQQGNINVKEDILSRYIKESEKDPTKMDDKYLRDVVLSFMLAGKDTTASSVSWFFFMLCKNPLVQEKVAQEIREIVGVEDELVNIDFFMQKLTDSALEKMHYLHAALTETMRLYPIAPMNPRTAESDDILPDGYRVKKGDEVVYLTYSMGRMAYLWGEDAEEFKPERWLKNGIFQPESPFKFVTFHAGPRICLGKEFAYLQMKILSATLLHFFRFKLADETKKVEYATMVTLKIHGGLPLLAIPRKKIT